MGKRNFPEELRDDSIENVKMPGLKLNLAGNKVKSNSESADGAPVSLHSAEFNKDFNAHVVVKSGDSSCSSLKIQNHVTTKVDEDDQAVQRTQKKLHELIKLLFDNSHLAPELEV